MNDLVKNGENALSPENEAMNTIDNLKKLAKKLMETQHYRKMGEEGIFAIGLAAKTLNMTIFEALNGGLYFVQGRVGMSAEMMNRRIREAGHSIKLIKLDEMGCTLLGKRHDTGDTAEIHYGLEDAKNAGKSYEKNRKDMYFARCLSRLKRILFPDIATKIYEKDELKAFVEAEQETGEFGSEQDSFYEEECISENDINHLNSILSQCNPKYVDLVHGHMKKEFNAENFSQLTKEQFSRILSAAEIKREDHQRYLEEINAFNPKEAVVQGELAL